MQSTTGSTAAGSGPPTPVPPTDLLDAILREHAELEFRLAEPGVHADQDAARKLGRRYAELGQVVEAHRQLTEVEGDLDAARELAAEDTGWAAEAESLSARRTALSAHLTHLLLPRDPLDAKDVILEIKAGEGGEESALFAGDLLRMYLRYAERRGWKTEVLDAVESDLGGYKDVSVAVKSRGSNTEGVWARMKFEGGVHRVQRVPVTESQGRIHTSAAGVLALPEAEDVEVAIDQGDLRIDVFRSSGPGGQSVNTTDSAVRITHLPTGIVVSCQNERSQIQNRATAMIVLQTKLLERTREEEAAAMDAIRGTKGDIAFGSQIRNYVLHPYQMVKDLRTEYESGNTSGVLDGEIDEFIEAGIRWRRSAPVEA